MSDQASNKMAGIASFRVLDGMARKNQLDYVRYRCLSTKLRLAQYLKNWIRWAKTGVSLNIKALILKTTEILQNTLNVQAPLKSN